MAPKPRPQPGASKGRKEGQKRREKGRGSGRPAATDLRRSCGRSPGEKEAGDGSTARRPGVFFVGGGATRETDPAGEGRPPQRGQAGETKAGERGTLATVLFLAWELRQVGAVARAATVVFSSWGTERRPEPPREEITTGRRETTAQRKTSC